MPLPAGGSSTPWPPPNLKPVLDQMGLYAAWWEGDPDRLSAVYGGTADTGATSQHSFERPKLFRPSSYRGSLVGTLQRWFWGQPTPPQQQRNKVHVPVAAEIAAASADLLFSHPISIKWGDEDARRAKRDEQVAAEQERADAEAASQAADLPPDPLTGLPAPPPKAEPVEVPDVPDDPAQLRFDELRECSGLDAVLLEAAEVAAALSGVYLRLAWDAEIQDGPWIDVVHPDSAVPEFSYGRLRAVTFWRDVTGPEDRQNGRCIRHLERHEPGRILHGLYEGDRDMLGRQIPLTEAPDLAGLAAGLVDGNEIPAVPGRLTAAYIPNVRPAPQWRRDPQLAPLGRSDYTQGVLGLMDRLDEVMTSWMRDIRLGKARIMVPEQYVENQGRGQGAVFDADKEVYTPLNILAAPGGPPQITATQFAIRVDEHERTARWLIDQIVRAAGYATQTIGSDGDGAMATATEVNAKERRSILTREKKARYWDSELTQLFWTWLLLDHALAEGGNQPDRADVERGGGDGPAGAKVPVKKTAPPVQPDAPPEIEFPPLAQADELTLAQTAQAMFAASAASKYTLVRLLHPDWDEDQVQDELARMDEDAQAAAPPAPEDLGTEQPLGVPPEAGGGLGADDGGFGAEAGWT